MIEYFWGWHQAKEFDSGSTWNIGVWTLEQEKQKEE